MLPINKKMRNSFLIVLLIIIVSCKGETKKETETSKTTPKAEKVVTTTYPNLEDAPDHLNYIFENGFEFSDDIKVNYIALHSKGGDKYQLIYILDPESDLERIETLKVSAVFYAENPKLFKDKLYQDKKARQIAAYCKVMMLDKEPILTQEFSVVPKNFTQVKFYFYSDNGVINDRMLTVRKINMPK